MENREPQTVAVQFSPKRTYSIAQIQNGIASLLGNDERDTDTEGGSVDGIHLKEDGIVEITLTYTSAAYHSRVVNALRQLSQTSELQTVPHAPIEEADTPELAAA